VHLGDGSPDSRGGLPFSVTEVLMRLFCELLGAEEMFRSGHRPSSCPGVGYWSDTALIHAVNFICLPGASGLRPRLVAIETTAGEMVEALEQPRALFASHTLETPWTRLQMAYFVGTRTSRLLSSSGGIARCTAE
jgi:hypothetical protein